MDNHSQTVEFPYQPPIGKTLALCAFLGVLGAGLLYMILRSYDPATNFFDFVWALKYQDKKGLFAAAVLIIITVYALARIPAVLAAGDLNVIRLSHDGITMPTGYFEIRPLFIAYGDILTITRRKGGYASSGEYMRIQHRDGKVNINRPWLPDKAAFELLWQYLQQYQQQNQPHGPSV